MVAVFYFCLLFQPSDVDAGEPLSPLSVAAAAIDSVGVTVPSPLTENGDTPSLPVFGPPAVAGEFNVAALPSESSRSGTDSASESERDSEFGVARPREVDDIPSSRSPPLEVSGPSWFSRFATFAMRPCLGVRGSVPSSLFFRLAYDRLLRPRPPRPLRTLVARRPIRLLRPLRPMVLSRGSILLRCRRPSLSCR